jgi:hypothetical protein
MVIFQYFFQYPRPPLNLVPLAAAADAGWAVIDPGPRIVSHGMVHPVATVHLESARTSLPSGRSRGVEAFVGPPTKLGRQRGPYRDRPRLAGAGQVPFQYPRPPLNLVPLAAAADAGWAVTTHG